MVDVLRSNSGISFKHTNISSHDPGPRGREDVKTNKEDARPANPGGPKTKAGSGIPAPGKLNPPAAAANKAHKAASSAAVGKAAPPAAATAKNPAAVATAAMGKGSSRPPPTPPTRTHSIVNQECITLNPFKRMISSKKNCISNSI